METIDRLIDTTELERILQDLGADVAAGYKDALETRDHRATGALISSVTSHLEINGTHYEVTLSLEDYWKYLENGTKAHWPPRSAILKWIDAKHIIPHPDENGRVPSRQSLAFLICRAIAGQSPNQRFLRNPNGGTIGTHGLRTTVEAVLPVYRELLRDALGRAFGNYIQQVISFQEK